MLGIGLLVFREVLEAALIITIVAAATRGVSNRASFIGGGIGLGVAGAVVVAMFAGVIAQSIGGSGQEVFNASVLLAAVAMIGWHVIWMSSHGRELAMQMQSLGDSVKAGSSSLAMLLAVVALAVLREGSEIVLFLYGFMAGGMDKLNLLAGSSVGLAGGLVVGLTLYFGLLRIPMRHFFSVTNWMLILLAAGLSSVAAGYLVQAGLLPAWGNTLWDTSGILSGHSLVGQTLHILVGYDARPSGMQLTFWLATTGLLTLGMKLMTGQSAKPAATTAKPATQVD